MDTKAWCGRRKIGTATRVVDGGGSVGDGVGGQNNGLRQVREWTPERVGVEGRHRVH